MITKLKLKLFNWLLNNFKQRFVDGTINFVRDVMSEKELFAFVRAIARRRSFVKEIRVVPIKKGKIKYTLLFVETVDGTYRLNLGRHRNIEIGYQTLNKI